MADSYPERRLSARYPTDLPAWRKLNEHYRDKMWQKHLRDLHARDRKRAVRFSARAGDLALDYSKTHVDATTKRLLVRLAKQAGVAAAIEAMFAGEKINKTEDRPVLHVALRSKISDMVALETPGVREVWEVLARMDAFVEGVQSGRIRGSSRRRFTDVVNIGIGGSDLGPVMASRALKPYWHPKLRFHAVSNVDGTQLEDLEAELDPERTLFVVCSKTFTTQETMFNAHAARDWIVGELDPVAVQYHFVAASTNHEAMDEFGIRSDYRFGFWDWVGGRYSMWSAVGLSLALVIGMDNFRDFLAGGRRMDLHFRQAPFEENVPVLLALLAVWYNNFYGAESHAILPYTNRLDRLPAYLQQMQMESNGKSVRTDGRPVRCKTGMIIWGEAGNNAQHSFMQLLHQGTRFVPVDFILTGESKLATANCRAQALALMQGTIPAGGPSDPQGIAAVGGPSGPNGCAAEPAPTGSPKGRTKIAAEAAPTEPYRIHAGDRPSNTIHFEKLSPETLGQLIALYEHKVFVEGVVWGIDSFDQWG
ncbi:MAG: glucose-6-phosphate isomerase, partial [Proteobacteria bacterium]|nr:glucose-6-phosphate isomerase [Pseudomonadota bacterium]